MTSEPGTFEPLQQKRVPAQIAESIVAAITRGDYPTGSRLPAERELASVLGVSRSSLRQALATLELAGIVSAQHGSGTTVVANADQLASWGQQILPPQILEVRMLIEPELAALAASKRTPETVAALEQALERLEAQGDQAGLDYDDHFFHLAIADAAQNPILANALRETLRYTNGPMWRQLKRGALESHASVRGHLEEARALVEAVRDGRTRDAADIWRDHLVIYRREMLNGQGR
ncbi:FadR/GntR family transcriptional regulator [Microbacterium sp. RD1]|uniref:FadR/GntR family transcriptional regulator n=1 Tax=Microbacterium sp. RD1 TaxID=3457313 RepID=UPI003FA5528B